MRHWAIVVRVYAMKFNLITSITGLQAVFIIKILFLVPICTEGIYHAFFRGLSISLLLISMVKSIPKRSITFILHF